MGTFSRGSVPRLARHAIGFSLRLFLPRSVSSSCFLVTRFTGTGRPPQYLISLLGYRSLGRFSAGGRPIRFRGPPRSVAPPPAAGFDRPVPPVPRPVPPGAPVAPRSVPPVAPRCRSRDRLVPPLVSVALPPAARVPPLPSRRVPLAMPRRSALPVSVSRRLALPRRLAVPVPRRSALPLPVPVPVPVPTRPLPVALPRWVSPREDALVPRLPRRAEPPPDPKRCHRARQRPTRITRPPTTSRATVGDCSHSTAPPTSAIRRPRVRDRCHAGRPVARRAWLPAVLGVFSRGSSSGASAFSTVSTRSDAFTGAAAANTDDSSFSARSLTVITSSVISLYHIN